MAVAATAGGAVLIWSGIKGHKVTDTLRSVVSGQRPAGTTDLPITDTGVLVASAGAAGQGGAAGATGSAIADDALRYAGKGYVWGGAPAKGAGNWDCSSFANWVIGHDLGQPIPGYRAGAYDGRVHGPTTVQWLIYGTAVKGGAAAAQPGDLCVWQTHMGIATGGGSMISALNPRLGTRQTTIAAGAPGAEMLFVRRLG